MSLTWAEINERVARLKRAEGYWEGCPVPMEGFHLIVEPRHALHDALKEINAEFTPRTPPENSGTVVNSWYSVKLRQMVYMIRNKETGKPEVWIGPSAEAERLSFTLNTTVASDIWPLDAESRAQASLARQIDERRCRQYLLTGMFAETSRRSGLLYFFRRLRPTLAVSKKDGVVLAALCLHPIGYYQDCHAGSMVPTDEVLAHLMMMRADEPFFWRRANQHAPWLPQAGI